jgi:hypothetical protein
MIDVLHNVCHQKVGLHPRQRELGVQKRVILVTFKYRLSNADVIDNMYDVAMM